MAASNFATQLKTVRVCQTCFEGDVTNYRLLTQECMDPGRHCHSPRVEVCWSVRDGRAYEIRPTPDKVIIGKFILCFQFPHCKRGKLCTYAHNEVECAIWNKRKQFRSGFVEEQRHSSRDRQAIPSHGNFSHEGWPPLQQPHPPQRRSDSQRPLIPQQSSQRPQLPKSSHVQRPQQSLVPQSQPKQGAAAAVYDSRVHELTPGNYQYKFTEMINLEESSHEKILSERCNGKYQLSMDNWWVYLSGISGDNIAYATQASEEDGVCIYYNGYEVRASIRKENYSQTKEDFYIDIEEKVLKQCFPLLSKRKPYNVDVEFVLKKSYFFHLKQFVRALTPEVIRRIMPKADYYVDFKPIDPDTYHDLLNLKVCPEDQQKALATAISSPSSGPPAIITGPFGTGKTRVLALITHYFLQQSAKTKKTVSILVCTQQHTSADAFITCLEDMIISMPEKVYIARIITRNKKIIPGMHHKTSDSFGCDISRSPPTSKHPYLVVTTCQTAHSIKKKLPPNFHFSHIFLDEAAQMREAEAVAPLCMANSDTKIVIAGDKQQVGPELLVLGEECRQKGFFMSLLERLEGIYKKTGRKALHYMARLVTNHRCHGDIVSLAEKLFYEPPLKSVVRPGSTHPDAPFPLVFVCSSLRTPEPCESPINDFEAEIIIEQMTTYASNWPKDSWGAKLDPLQMCIMSPSRTQVNAVKELLFDKDMNIPDKLKQVEKHPAYDMQGREYRALFLSTFEATHEDGSTRNPTKSIADPYVFNTVITRARSLVVSVGNPYLLLKMEEHMVRRYGKKGKCWSTYLKRCLEKDSLSFHRSVGVCDADRQEYIDKLTREVDKHLAVKCTQDESTGTFGSDYTPLQKTDSADGNEDYEIPSMYTGRLEMDFSIKEELGKGGFGRIYRVKSRTDEGSYALKIVKLSHKKSSYKKILDEVRGLRKLDQPASHPNIVRYYGCWIDVSPMDHRKKQSPWNLIEKDEAIPDAADDSGTGSERRDATTIDNTLTSVNYSSDSAAITGFTTTVISKVKEVTAGPQLQQGAPCLLIRTELCGKTLKKWLETHKNRRRKRLFGYFEQILKAVDYIHKKNLVHRDLKPSNIFFSLLNDREDRGVLKVGDFGLVAGAGILSDSSSGSGSQWSEVSCSGLKGTPLYMSPEQRTGARCTEKVDIYALGMIYFEMNYIFDSPQEKERMMREIHKNFKLPASFSQAYPKEAAAIEKMICLGPQQRPSAEHILESRWFEELGRAVAEEPTHITKI